MKQSLLYIAILWISFASTAFSYTQIIYKEIRIPMSEAGPQGLEALLVWPNDSEHHPVALISHGSPRDLKQRSQMNAISFLPIAMEFARRGFATAVVMRRGYGSSGGDYVESIGQCASPDYLRSAFATSKDLHAVIAYLSTLPYFDTSRILAVGVSAGGLATIALTADHPPSGLFVAINFAGGRGSQSKNTVCKQDNLIQTFGILGKTSHVPMLWIYAKNDTFFNPILAKQFYTEFTKNGGNALFMTVPDYDGEGHFFFSNNNISGWTPIVDHFLKDHGWVFVDKLLPLPDTSHMIAPKKLSLEGKNDFAKYIKAAPHKAFAISSDGAYGWRTAQRLIDEAKQQAKNYCQQHTKKSCNIIAVDDEMLNHE